eukprot:13349962-Ditylum_brightwellii.AAC.1
MSTPAERFLGNARLTTPRDIAAVHTIDVIVKKTDRENTLDAKVMNKLRESAEASLSMKFDVFWTKPGTPEFKN